MASGNLTEQTCEKHITRDVTKINLKIIQKHVKNADKSSVSSLSLNWTSVNEHSKHSRQEQFCRQQFRMVSYLGRFALIFEECPRVAFSLSMTKCFLHEFASEEFYSTRKDPFGGDAAPGYKVRTALVSLSAYDRFLYPDILLVNPL